MSVKDFSWTKFYHTIYSMKIFISHSSKDGFYGQKLVDLLRGVGVHESEIIFTSNSVYGIPTAENIFNWLKSQITQKPFVIYLLSKDYYNSIACLNEMGAAWIIENKHAAIFIPDFDLESLEFQSAALDPREFGFFINDEDRILLLLQALTDDFKISKNIPLLNQEVKKLLSAINDYRAEIQESAIQEKSFEKLEKSTIDDRQLDLYTKFINLITTLKFKEEELLLLHYIIETGRFKLMTGWQLKDEISNIREWEEKNEIDNSLSANYSIILNRFELYGFTEVSSITINGKSKEIKIKDEIVSKFFELPEAVSELIKQSFEKSHLSYLQGKKTLEKDFLFKKDIWDYIYKFTHILKSNFPKNESGIVHSNNLKKIDKLFQSIKDCEELFDDQLWWHNGSSNSSFKLTNKGEGIWSLNIKEITIEEVWIHHDSSFFNDFIFVHFKKGEPFIIGGEKQLHNVIVDDKYEISWSEYENGYAEINDDVIDLSLHKVELVERMAEDGFLIICTKYHCALNRLNDTTIIEFIKNLKTRKDKITITDFQEFETKIRKHIHLKVEMDL